MTGGADLLSTIVAATVRTVEIRQASTPMLALERRVVRAPEGQAFAAAVRQSDPPRVIAECKRRSPSRGILRRDYHPADHAIAYEKAGAAAISVLTEPMFFDGSLDHLAQVRAATGLPILRKDFLVTDYQLVEAAAHGADAVLLIAGALNDAELHRLTVVAAGLGLAALVEVHDAAELQRAIGAGAGIIGVNSRNLRTLAVDANVFDDLIAKMPSGTTAVAESGIGSAEDLARLSRAGYHAFLVGERLMSRSNPGRALRELRGQ
jgi:indole-3-glycerol phosphate synthase